MFYIVKFTGNLEALVSLTDQQVSLLYNLLEKHISINNFWSKEDVFYKFAFFYIESIKKIDCEKCPEINENIIERALEIASPQS